MDILLVVERQFSYIANVFHNRRQAFQESFENSLFEGEQSAADVYLHGVKTLYKYCSKLLNPDFEESRHIIEFDQKLSVLEQYIDLYKRTLLILKEIEQKFTNEELKQKVINPLNPASNIVLLDWIALNVMHSITHIGQALRLQTLYLRYKMG